MRRITVLRSFSFMKYETTTDFTVILYASVKYAIGTHKVTQVLLRWRQRTNPADDALTSPPAPLIPFFHQASLRAGLELVPNCEPVLHVSAAKDPALSQEKTGSRAAPSLCWSRHKKHLTSGAGGWNIVTNKLSLSVAALMWETKPALKVCKLNQGLSSVKKTLLEVCGCEWNPCTDRQSRYSFDKNVFMTSETLFVQSSFQNSSRRNSNKAIRLQKMGNQQWNILLVVSQNLIVTDHVLLFTIMPLHSRS